MNACAQIPEEIIFSAGVINNHLQKIFADRMFQTSDILKRFLSFIVKETIEGRSNQLKEYTIGVNVLNKCADFKPQQDAIVRIHAGRLRRALNHYYKEAGKEEPIRISIPKGSYVPFFIDAKAEENTEIIFHRPGIYNTKNTAINLVVAVMPFDCFENGKSIISFSEGLAAQLSTELTHIKNLSVIAYYTMRRLAQKIFDTREIISSVGAQYVFAGDIQHQDGRLRINVQLINTNTSEQEWSEIYERELTTVNMFDIQDDIVTQIVSVFENHCQPGRTKLTIAS